MVIWWLLWTKLQLLSIPTLTAGLWAKAMSISAVFIQGYPGQECKWQKMTFASGYKASQMLVTVAPQGPLLISQACGVLCPHRLRSLLFQRLKGPKPSRVPDIKVSVITWPVPVHISKVKACTWRLNLPFLQLPVENDLVFQGARGNLDH